MSILKARVRASSRVTCLLAAFFSAPALAADPPVTMGEVGTRVTRADVDLASVVRKAFERELRALPMTPARERYVLSASLVRLDGAVAGGSARTECMVSAVLREKKSGAIRAMIEGKAHADGGDSSAQAAIGTVEAAVRGESGSASGALKPGAASGRRTPGRSTPRHTAIGRRPRPARRAEPNCSAAAKPG